ncbi:MAG: phosphotransferase [Solirubrobacteraceae bacterium]|nr:phosphotransferase [Solirubrobacteraceae bacterium]
MSVAQVTCVVADCAAFARHHQISLVAGGKAIQLAGSGRGGGFATVHPVLAIGGAAPGVALVAKVFKENELADLGGGQVVVETLTGLWGALGVSGRPDWPELVLALPFQLLTVQLDGKKRFVALMLDLGARGYVPAPTSQKGDVAAYRQRTLDERIAFATSVAEKLGLLAECGLLHGDLNPDNVMIHPRTHDVQVIDFDAGRVVTTGSERSRVPGKGDIYVPPEVNDPNAPQGFDLSRFSLEAERWSYASLIGLFLFTVHPGFFLNGISALSGYASAADDWPDVDENAVYFRADALTAYAAFRPIFEMVPAELTTLFATLFRAGPNAAARPTAHDWVGALSGVSEPPTIKVRLVGDDIVIEGDDVVIAWCADNALYVELDPGGRQPATGSMTFVAKEHFHVRVAAVNAFGSETVESPTVRVVPLPKIERVRLPVPPAFQMPALSIAAQLPRGLVDVPAAQPYPAPPTFARSYRGPAEQPSPELPAPPRFARAGGPRLMGSSLRRR